MKLKGVILDEKSGTRQTHGLNIDDEERGSDGDTEEYPAMFDNGNDGAEAP